MNNSYVVLGGVDGLKDESGLNGDRVGLQIMPTLQYSAFFNALRGN